MTRHITSHPQYHTMVSMTLSCQHDENTSQALSVATPKQILAACSLPVAVAAVAAVVGVGTTMITYTLNNNLLKRRPSNHDDPSSYRTSEASLEGICAGDTASYSKVVHRHSRSYRNCGGELRRCDHTHQSRYRWITPLSRIKFSTLVHLFMIPNKLKSHFLERYLIFNYRRRSVLIFHYFDLLFFLIVVVLPINCHLEQLLQ